MITLKSPREIEGMATSGALLADTHVQLRSFIKPGISTMDIEKFVRNYIESNGGVAAQIGYEGYKYATCCSVNQEVCHGFPTHQKLKVGDLLKVDMCVGVKGFLSDSCWTYIVGEHTSSMTEQLMEVTKSAMYKGIEMAQVGNTVGDIGYVMNEYIKPFGYYMCDAYAGHGLGPTIHEDPNVPFVGQKGKGTRLKEGMVITVEPILNTDTPFCTIDKNGWTSRTIRGGLSCQYEHSIAITASGPRILTLQKED